MNWNEAIEVICRHLERTITGEQVMPYQVEDQLRELRQAREVLITRPKLHDR